MISKLNNIMALSERNGKEFSNDTIGFTNSH